jgi:hypothetical protein
VAANPAAALRRWDIAYERSAALKESKPGDYIIIEHNSGLTVAEKFADNEISD